MARPRVNQFANDLSISRNQAVKLINKGRSKKDGGSQVLESNMNKMKGYKKGGVGPIPLPDEAKRIRLAAALDPKRREDKEALTKEQITKQMLEKENKAEKARAKGRMAGGVERRGDDQPVIMAKDGKFVCRGGGAAVRGTGFSGVR
tara:strand:+ start:468 stop:908 length:441 start_codon:yes stop_codon:yes gene_type:complete